MREKQHITFDVKKQKNREIAEEIQRKALAPILRKKNDKPYTYVYMPLDVWNHLKNFLKEPGKIEGVPADENIKIFGMKLVTHIDKDIAESGDTLFMGHGDFDTGQDRMEKYAAYIDRKILEKQDAKISQDKYRDYYALIHACNHAMAEKLWENDHKCGFGNIDIPYATKRIHEELVELEEAVTAKEIRREAADIANFAAMIILRCDKIMANTEKSVKKSGDV